MLEIKMRAKMEQQIEAARVSLAEAKQHMRCGRVAKATSSMAWAQSYIAEANKIAVMNLTNNGASDA